MKVVIQRVSQAHLDIDNTEVARIHKGMVILLGIEVGDTLDDLEYLLKKIVKLRIYDDSTGVMNLDITQVEGEVLLVSQFTLLADTRKGNRPSYIKAARPDEAIPLYQTMIDRLQESLQRPIQTGRFGADMQVTLTNDGPVTILIDSKER